MEDLIRELLLKNAFKYNGKANPKAIIGTIIKEYPDVKTNMKDAMKKINEIANEVNSLSLDEQKELIEQNYPEFFEKKERNIFSFFKINEGDYVKTAFPPGPEKYPHIGHAKAILLNYMLAKQYNGKFVLRFEDTNPKLVKKEFYQIMLDDFKWVGVNPDEVLYASDYMDLFKNYAKELIEKGLAYMCFCDKEQSSDNRQKKKECTCRSKSIQENLKQWNEFETYPEEKAVLRLKIDMAHKNSTMRDPTIFRVIDAKHARHGNKYRVWPTYDFQNSILDGYLKISHRIRSIEFEMRSELHQYIRKLFNLYPTKTYEMARFDIIGMPLSGRKIRELVENSPYKWQDPQLGTIIALRRRGFTKEAIQNFVIGTGISKNISKIDLSELIKQNKRVLDKIANRYFFIENPVKIKIKNSKNQKIYLKSNPNSEKKDREFILGDECYIEKKDFDKIKDNDIIRLIDNINIIKKTDGFEFYSESYEESKDDISKIIHFLSCEPNETKEVEILMPDKTILKGLAEKNIINLKVGDIIQFERFGFVRLDEIIDNKYKFWFTHN